MQRMQAAMDVPMAVGDLRKLCAASGVAADLTVVRVPVRRDAQPSQADPR